MFEAGIEATAWARTSTLRLRLRHEVMDNKAGVDDTDKYEITRMILTSTVSDWGSSTRVRAEPCDRQTYGQTDGLRRVDAIII